MNPWTCYNARIYTLLALPLIGLLSLSLPSLVLCCWWCSPVFCKVCLADPDGSATNSQGILGYISVISSLKCTYFFNYRNNVLLKIIAKAFSIGDVFISYDN